jgi:hypothetical protein
MHVMTLIMFYLVCSGCVTYFGYDGPCEGRVIDRDTRQPIEGAVVDGTWVKSYPGPGGASGKYYDSKEVLTDKGGKFKIEGVGLLILSNMEEMEVNVFKAGYTQWQAYWSSPKRSKYSAESVEWEGDKAIFKLRRMTMEERKERVANTPRSAPANNTKLFRLEENRERLEIGRPLHKVE